VGELAAIPWEPGLPAEAVRRREPRNALDAAERAASESDAAARERGKVPHADPLTAATALAASRSRRR
jgi:hypothetical protein